MNKNNLFLMYYNVLLLLKFFLNINRNLKYKFKFSFNSK